MNGAAESRRSAGTAGVTVVVVDDNRDGAEALSMLLELLGHEVVAVAHDGPSALELVIARKPRVVLLDLGLPGLGGLEVARLIRERSELAGVRLIALTGRSTEFDRAAVREAGFDDMIVKPAEHDALSRALDTQNA